MTLDWALPALRWALFADLGLVFGVPMAAVITDSRDAVERWRGTLAVAALLGIALGLVGFVLVVANMAGLPPGALDRTLVMTLLTGAAIGWALILRSAALALYVGLALGRSPPLLIGAGGVAVATLAWSGHAAASDGAAGWIRLGGDIAHLLAALGWVGALALFAAQLWRPDPAGQVARALANFGSAGSVIVAVLALTGAANLAFLMTASELLSLNPSPYGRLLRLKLALLLIMLGLAALNRFTLVPRLEQAQHGEARLSAMSRLRLSIALEALAALAVLGLVAWAGTLDPLGIGH